MKLKKIGAVVMAAALALSSVVTAAPVTAAAEESGTKSGTCGENLTWTLSDDFVLTISGASAFANCTSLKKITIPASVTSIGASAFSGDKKLKTIIVKSKKLKTVGKNALKGTNAKAKVKVPAKKLSAYKKLFKGKGQSKKVTITK